jgi:hypothetical protein
MEQQERKMTDAELERIHESLCRDIVRLYHETEAGGKARELFEKLAWTMAEFGILDDLSAEVSGASPDEKD